MANIKPFKALRPQAQLAKLVASRPYDVLSSAEAKIEAFYQCLLHSNHSTLYHSNQEHIF